MYNRNTGELIPPATCNDPRGSLTIMCSGGELGFVGHEISNYDCKIDQEDKTKATCSYSDGSAKAMGANIMCLGKKKDELMLTANVDGDTDVSCPEGGTSPKNIVGLLTMCHDWIDLDDQ